MQISKVYVLTDIPMTLVPNDFPRASADTGTVHFDIDWNPEVRVALPVTESSPRTRDSFRGSDHNSYEFLDSFCQADI